MKHEKNRRVILKLQGEFVDYMCQANPKYLPYVTLSRGRKTLYFKLLRALYGCIESALLWYNLFEKTLEKMGFQMNPYNKYVANKMIEGSQCTIMWYVDDAKVSHKSKKVVQLVISQMEKHFGPLHPTYGHNQQYLGMKISIDEQKYLHIDTRDQVCKIIDDFCEPINGSVSTPAQKNLMELNEDAEILNKSKKLLYLKKRGRPDLETAISFLTTRVSNPNVNDWRKLKRVLIYLK